MTKPTMLLVVLPALCIQSLPVRADDDLRETLTSGAATSLDAAFGAFDSVLGQALSGYSPVRLNDKGLFLATQATGEMPRLWAAFEAREYHGDTEGHSFAFLSAYERQFGPKVRLGFAGALGGARFDFDSRVQTRTLTFAPYLRAQLSDVSRLQAWLTFARPEYDFDDGTHRAQRLSAGFSYSTDVAFRNFKLTGTMSVSGAQERHSEFWLDGEAQEGFEISRLNASLGARATFWPEATLSPYLSFGVNQSSWRSDDDHGSGQAETLGTGLVWTGRKQSLSLQVDGGRVFDADHPFAFTTQYTLNF